MTIEKGTELLAAALLRASAEHGRPNSFGAAELHRYHGGPRPTLAVRIGTRYLIGLYVALGGREKFGSCPRYDCGRFYV